MGGYAPRARGDSVRPRRLVGASGRPLNFTVRTCVHPVLRFRASVLDVSRERQNPISPIHGESLLRWIAERWSGASPVSEPAPEDWGWYAHVSWDGKRYMLGASCSDAPSGERDWVLQIVKFRTVGERLLGRNKMAKDDRCLREVLRLLETEPAFHDVTLV